MATRARIGNVEVIAVVDCVPPAADPEWPFPGVRPEAWAPHRKYALDANGMWQGNIGVFVLRSPDATVIVDTGMGRGFAPRSDRQAGKLTSLSTRDL